MKRKLIVLIGLILITYCFGFNNIFARSGKDRINQLIKAFTRYDKNNRSSVKAIESIIDLDFLAKRSMNIHWNKMSDDQKKQFINIFNQLVEKLAYSKTKDYFRNNKYIISKETNETKRDYLLDHKKVSVKLIAVNVKIDYETGTGIKKESVIFYLIKQPNGLVIFDIEMLEGSIVKDYRNQFSKTIRDDGGIDGLIKKLEKKLKEE
ncbi:MAG: ABC transporter substrate-binding protein [Spirochaetota bacterium]|nr:ABC transporter substrate-binding protein [Spirochaetota bacterium]